MIHLCDERLLPEECIECIGGPRPVVVQESWAGTEYHPCEVLRVTPRRFRVRFLGSGRHARGEVRYVPHGALLDDRRERAGVQALLAQHGHGSAEGQR